MVISPAEAVARLRAARSKQLAAIERIDAELRTLAQEVAARETERERAISLSGREAGKRRAPKRAAGLLATASVPATISLSLALGPLGLLGLVGVGVGTGIAYRLDTIDRKNEETLRSTIDAINEKIRQLSVRKDTLMTHRSRVEEKLRLTRALLDRLRGGHG